MFNARITTVPATIAATRIQPAEYLRRGSTGSRPLAPMELWRSMTASIANGRYGSRLFHAVATAATRRAWDKAATEQTVSRGARFTLAGTGLRHPSGPGWTETRRQLEGDQQR